MYAAQPPFTHPYSRPLYQLSYRGTQLTFFDTEIGAVPVQRQMGGIVAQMMRLVSVFWGQMSRERKED
jgi:hypothetical protein